MIATCQANLSLCHFRHAFHKVASPSICQIALNQKSLHNFQKRCKFSACVKLREKNCIKQNLPVVIIYNIPFLWLLRVTVTVYVYNQSRTVHPEWTDNQNCWNIALWASKNASTLMLQLIAAMMQSTYIVSYMYLQECNKIDTNQSSIQFIISKEPYIERECNVLKEVNSSSSWFFVHKACFYEGSNTCTWTEVEMN